MLQQGEIIELVLQCFSTPQNLLGLVFFAHDEPRFRDNQRRALESLPLRGSPTAQQRVVAAKL